MCARRRDYLETILSLEDVLVVGLRGRGRDLRNGESSPIVLLDSGSGVRGPGGVTLVTEVVSRLRESRGGRVTGSLSIQTGQGVDRGSYQGRPRSLGSGRRGVYRGWSDAPSVE